MTSFMIYIPDNLATITAGDVPKALAEFEERHQREPCLVRCHLDVLPTVTAKLAAMGSSIPTATNGGCLANELWLDEAEKTNDIQE